MGITRVELQSGRRDSRLLRATVQRVRELDDLRDTVPNKFGETDVAAPMSQVVKSDPATSSLGPNDAKRSKPAPARISDEELRRELNLTRELHLSSPQSPKSDSPKMDADSRPSKSSGKPAHETARRGEATQDPHRGPATDRDLNANPLAGTIAGQVDPKPTNGGESRLDLISGEWTLYATTRSQRPDQFAGLPPQPTAVVDCPFCDGQEHRTPQPVWSAKLDDDDDQSADWSVRVVPNLYPAVTRAPSCRHGSDPVREPADDALPPSARRHRTIEASRLDPINVTAAADSSFEKLKTPEGPQSASVLFPHQPATGGHEVIIESPRHTESFSELNTAEMALVFTAYSQRIRHWQNIPGIEHVSIFKNVGRDAGASLQHSHSQLIATSRVPTVVRQVTRRLQAHYARTGSCLQCDLVRGEVQERSRLVSQTDSFVAYCPYASRFPLQVRVTSKEHLACFSELRPPHVSEVARLVLRIVRWLEALRPGTAYNVLLHTCPVKFDGARESQHWAIDVFPRMSRLAGFELATGAMINPIFPESAAKAFREQARLSDPRYVLR